MDLGTAYAYADAFANALLADDEDVLGSSLRPDPEAQVSRGVSGYLRGEPKLLGTLEMLPRPIKTAEVLSVSPPLESNECISIIRVSGRRQEVLLRVVWVEHETQVLIKSAEIV